MKDRGKCFECGENAQCDHHVIPKILGGTKTIPLCRPCHSKVHSRDLVSMAGLQNKGKADRKAEGGFVGGRPGFGWKSIADPNHAKGKIRVRNEDEQLIIQKLIAWRKSGRSFTSFGHHAWEWFGIEKNTSTWIRTHARETQNS